MRPGTEFQTVVHRLYQIIDLDLILPARGTGRHFALLENLGPRKRSLLDQ